MLEDVKWLKSCPCSDCNFKIHLKNASTDELVNLLKILPQKGNISKIDNIISEINRRSKANA